MSDAMFAVRHDGARPATLFIHGAGQSGAYWGPMADRLAALGMARLVPDLPGFGRSAAVPGPYTLPAIADALAALIVAHGAPMMVVGNSMGGAIAQLLALDHPTLVCRLVLAASGPFMPNADDVARRWGDAAASWAERDVEEGVRRYFQRPEEQPMLDRFYEDARLASPEASTETMLSNAATNTLARLHEIAVPTLVIQGRHDRARTVEHGQMIAERIKGARIEILERSGHTPHLDEPEAFAALAVPFLQAGASHRRPD